MNDWTLHEGDCLDFLPEYAGLVDLIVTSPPYDNLRDYGGHSFDFDRVADAVVPTLKPGGVLVWIAADAVVNGSETGTSFRQALGFMERGLRLHDTMIYLKATPLPAPQGKRYWAAFEYMFVLSLGEPSTFNMLTKPRVSGKRWGQNTRPRDGDRWGIDTSDKRNAEGRLANVWEFFNAGGAARGGNTLTHPDFQSAHEHPATFPYALAADHIKTWTDPGDLVLDPMAGSGTTLRAALDLGRRAVGMEINPPYCDLIRRRMAQGVLV